MNSATLASSSRVRAKKEETSRKSAQAKVSRSWTVLLIIAPVLVAYANSFSGPFIFDDIQSTTENPTIHSLWPPWAPFITPAHSGVTAAGRPVVNYTLAVNYALGGLQVGGYHAFNLAIHLAAALVLFGILRRTYRLPLLQEKFGSASVPLAIAATLLWALHPLQTESVTYIIQRAESLAGLFYFLTIYSFLRATESQRPNRWYILSIMACAVGLGAKEIVVTAPLIVLLYDRTLVSGSFAAAWSRRRYYYMGMASTWLFLGYLMSTTANRGNTMGFGMGVSPWSYFLTENRVLIDYLRLAVWPHPLCLDDYGMKFAHRWQEVAPQMLFLSILAGTVFWFLRKPSVIGLAGAWFFLILSPTSSVIPIADPEFEHRMYEPLAGLAALLSGALYGWCGKRSYWILGALIVLYTGLTIERNRDYQSEKSIWLQTVEQLPTSARAQNNLGNGFFHQGELLEAQKLYEKALKCDSSYVEANNNLGVVLSETGHITEAIAQYQKTLALSPFYANALNNLANLLMQAGRTAEALDAYAKAAAYAPNDPNLRGNVGDILMAKGRREEALTEFQNVLQADPTNADANYHLGLLLAEDGRPADSLSYFETSLRKQPQSPTVLSDYGMALMRNGQTLAAVDQFMRAIALAPNYAVVRSNLGNAYFQLGRLPEAEQEFDEAIRSDPKLTDAYNDSAIVLVHLGHKREALARLRKAIELSPNNLRALSNLRLLEENPQRKVHSDR